MSSASTPRLETDRLLWTGGIVVGASLPHWPNLDEWIAVLLGACVVWRVAAALWAWPLPKTVIRVALALAAFAAVVVDYRTVNGLEAGSALLVVMVALKYLECRTQRDQLVLMMIAYFVVFAALLYERSFLTVVYLLAFVWLTTVALLQLGRRGPLLEFRPTSRLAGRLLLQALPIMLVLFVLFPRLPEPLWAMPGAITSGSSGLDDEMSPGDLTELGLSDDVAFRVEFVDAPPRADRLYWRGPVLSAFNGRTWTRDPGMRRRASSTLEHFGSPIEYRVMLEPHGRRWMFALEMPERWDESKNIFMNSDYQLLMRLSERVHSRIDYRVTSYTEFHAMEPLSDAERAAYTRLPPRTNPRTQALVEQWLASAREPREIIQRAFEMFQSEPFYYTLTPPPLGSHPVDDFLFQTREGFCEHYASAFAVMMRAAGIPARIVTGYQGGELNPLGQYFIIRQSNAHAWTEVWLADEGWVRVDPTAAVAPERIALGSSGAAGSNADGRNEAFRRLAWMRSALFAWDAVNTYWRDWVLGYGPELQSALLQATGFEDADWALLTALAAVLVAALLLALTLHLGWRHRRRMHRDPAARQFEIFCRKLSRPVAPRAPGEGPVSFGRRAALAVPEVAEDIARIVDAYVKARYEPDPQRAALERLRALVRQFRLPASAARGQA